MWGEGELLKIDQKLQCPKGKDRPHIHTHTHSMKQYTTYETGRKLQIRKNICDTNENHLLFRILKGSKIFLRRRQPSEKKKKKGQGYFQNGALRGTSFTGLSCGYKDNIYKVLSTGAATKETLQGLPTATATTTTTAATCAIPRWLSLPPSAAASPSPV